MIQSESMATMTKRKRSLSSDTSSPAFVYSTRSSAQKSLNLDTNVAKGRLTRDSSTPTTDRTNLSVDFQNSPSSSRTSSNIIEAIPTSILHSDHSRGSKAKSTSKHQAEDGTISPAASKASTNETPDRPGRRRKPTQKAAELAANSSSKLFKTGVTGQVRDDDADSAEENDEPVSERKLPIENAPEPLSAPSSGESPCEAFGQVNVERLPSNEATLKQQEEHKAPPTPELDSLEQSMCRPRMPKQRRRPKYSEETSVDQRKSMNTRKPRSGSKNSAIKINVIPPESTVSPESAKANTDPVTAPTTERRNHTSLPKHCDSSKPSKDTGSETKPPKKPPQRTVCAPEPPIVTAMTSTTTTVLTSHPSTQSPIESTNHLSTSSPPKPTRIKFKPLQNTIDSALAGYTRLPCDLSCLQDSDLFYIWAKLCIDHEDLADELCALEGDFDGGGVKGVRERVIRGKLNAFLVGFCVCDKNKSGKESKKSCGRGEK